MTAFGLLNRFAKGEDIEPFLLDFVGFNVLRIFWYTPRNEWGDSAWGYALGPSILDFCAFVGARGWFVELTLLTDDDPMNLYAAGDLLRWLSASGMPSNLLLEAGNEPTTHKHINTLALKPQLDSSGVLYSSGDYEDSSRWFGRYMSVHTGRDSEWPRRAHDLLEYYHGGGPNAPSDPAHRVPIVADEPIRQDQASGDRERDFLAYFGACSLLGAGATFHFESGKTGRRPNDDEKRFAAIALQAMNAFPADAPKGLYRRPVEHSLRTYVVGNSMVRVRPETPDAPEPGWRALDPGGVLWTR